MPTRNFSRTKDIQTPNVPVYTVSADVPQSISTAKVALVFDAADLLDPTTSVSLGLEWLPAGETDWSLARQFASVSAVGSPSNPPTFSPYIQMGARTCDLIRGQQVRGFLLSATAISVGIDVTVTF